MWTQNWGHVVDALELRIDDAKVQAPAVQALGRSLAPLGPSTQNKDLSGARPGIPPPNPSIVGMDGR